MLKSLVLASFFLVADQAQVPAPGVTQAVTPAVTNSDAQDLPRGHIIDAVKCAENDEQTYALYLPSNYSPDKKWSLIVAFDPRARGRSPVAVYQAAAEKYGYIVAGSNVSKNGPPLASVKAARAMLADLKSRFSIDTKRVYAAGQSGGSRFALDFALNTKQFAGVLASSAGFAHSTEGQVDLGFPLFGTAGTEDFNNLEMRKLDHQLTSVHRIRIFTGDHTWPTSEVAVEALEWMEIQAMRAGTRPRDEAMIEGAFKARKAQLAAMTNLAVIYYANLSMAADFDKLRDVSEYSKKADDMLSRKDVQDALRESGMDELQEGQVTADLANLTDQLGNDAMRAEVLVRLRTELTKLSTEAKAAADSPQRQRARRLLRGIIADNAGRPDPELRKLIDEVRP
jgi:dienelactone hydrolase